MPYLNYLQKEFIKMKNELSLIELIQLRLSKQEQNYLTALRNGKSDVELKEIELNIEYLKSCLTRVKRIIVPLS